MKPSPRKTWLITDTHFNHAAMVEYCGRPGNFNEVIIQQWKRLVAPDDLVIHLGDVIISRAAEIGDILAQLPGRKVLVLGNHDFHHGANWWMDRGFAFVCQQMVYKNVLLTHVPAKELPPNALFNVHGHFHNSDHHRWDCPTYEHCKLLAIEHTKYRPVEFNAFTERDKVVGKVILA